jgi:glycosidase
MPKFVIYQVVPRLFGNYNTTNKYNGSIDENGCGKFNSFTTKALSEIKDMGVTHIWYTGIIEHATQTDYSQYGIASDHPGVVKGKAGSFYAIKDFYDVDPDLAEDVTHRMAEFESLVKRTHEADMKVIIDFVPNHVARNYHSDAKPKGVKDLGETDNPEWAFSPLNNFYYLPGQSFKPEFDAQGYVEYPAKVTGNDKFTSSPSVYDWYETVKLNYGVNYQGGGEKQFDPIPDTWVKMRDILMYWAAKKVDGFRCDMAEMVPVEFWNWALTQVKAKYPKVIFIAEVYNPAEYDNYVVHGKFDFLYDKVGMYDLLRNVASRNLAATNISSVWQKLGGLEHIMLNFLENHDEQRIGSGFFSGTGFYAHPAMIISATLTKAPVMIYFGQELGELGMEAEGYSGMDGRTTIFDYWGVRSIQAWANNGAFDGAHLTSDQIDLRNFYKKLFNICINEKAISDGLMFDLAYANIQNPTFNSHKQFAFMRMYKDQVALIVVNFDDKCLETEIVIPHDAFEYLGLKEYKKYSYIDLLDQDTKYDNVILSPNDPLKTTMKPWSGKILKFKMIK